MAVKNVLKCVFINPKSDAQVEAEIVTNQSFFANLSQLARKSERFSKEFLAPDDQMRLKDNVTDRTSHGKIQFLAKTVDKTIALDISRPVSDAWTHAGIKTPLQEGQEFILLINDYCRSDNTRVVPSSDGTVIAYNGGPNSIDLSTISINLEILTKKVGRLTSENTKLQAENKKLSRRPGAFKSFATSLLVLLLGAAVTATAFSIHYGINPLSSESAAERDALQAENTKIKDENDSLKSENTTLRTEKDALEKENEELQSSVATLEDENKKLQSSVATLEDDKKKLEDDNQALNKNVADLEKEIEELKDKLNILDSDDDSSDGSKTTSDNDKKTSTGSKKIVKDDIMDFDRIEYIDKEGNSGKAITYSSTDVHEEGILLNPGYWGEENCMFTLEVPEGCSSLSFTIGHIKDSGKADASMSVEIENEKYEAGTAQFSYNKSPESVEIPGLKAGERITLRFDTKQRENRYALYGMTDIKFNK